MDKLKPCPFCGNGVKVWDTGEGVCKIIECKNCTVKFVFKYDNSGYDLLQAWNRRVDNG